MPTINFDSLKNSTISDKTTYLYSDLHLDLIQEVVPSDLSMGNIIGKDIELDYDLAAIKNSLINLFNTLPGQRVLIPEYGLNLLQYVFLPISKEYGEVIGKEIVSAVQKWETRVQIERVSINARPDDNEYDITIALYLPALKEYTGLEGTLGNRGFAPIIKG